MRSLIFTLWLTADKSAEETLKLIEKLTVAQFETIEQGNARIVRADVAGKSFQYELPADWSATDFMESLREAYRCIKIGGASGGEMTDKELEAYVIDEAGAVTDTMQVIFATGNNGGRV